MTQLPRAQSLVVREKAETVKTVSQISSSRRSPGSSPVWMRCWTVELLRQSRFSFLSSFLIRAYPR